MLPTLSCVIQTTCWRNRTTRFNAVILQCTYILVWVSIVKSSIYMFLQKKWLSEDGHSSDAVFMDRRRQAIHDAMIDALDGDRLFDQKTLEHVYSEIATSE